MLSKEQRSRNPKIGRPVKTEGGNQFKKEYLQNQTKFELECELLAVMHETFFIDPPTDPNNRRMEIDFITSLFEKHEAMETFRILLDLNEFFYKNSSVFPEDNLHYTSTIDVAYMFKQLRLKRGTLVRSVELVLTIYFFLYNEKLINYKAYQYLQPKVMKIAEDMVTGNIGETMGKIELLILNLVLELAVKENIQILH